MTSQSKPVEIDEDLLTAASGSSNIDTGIPLADPHLQQYELLSLPITPIKSIVSFQKRFVDWLKQCFSPEIIYDKRERNHRFLEEALELAQSCECTAEEAHQLVDYVFSRPVGEKHQEVGGVMATLAALCHVQNMDMHDAAEVELMRIWGKIDQIREKQLTKPKFIKE